MTHPARLLRRILSFATLIAFAVVGHAVSVHGTVTDPLGAPIANATVALVQNGKVVVAAKTGFDGGYTLVSADSGRFYVLASGKSFRQLQTKSFFGETLDDVQQNIVLEPEWVRQSVVVTA
ncbi:MAG TPA: carboxypeptidase-like regulatory domain-containing protein, partial [Acidobacteriaceae bacterium]|nr:carboxypeptidase-like regulatory domain-containing protein [Acidobacteriaceae bacterium]